MEPIKIHIKGAEATVTSAPKITAGMVKLPVEFTFDESWDEMTKNALYRAGDVTRMEPNIHSTGTVDALVMRQLGKELQIGMYGTKTDGTQLPTVWVAVDIIREGTQPAAEKEADPAQPVWERALQAVQDIPVMIEAALEEAKESGAFDGPKGDPGVGVETEDGGEIFNDYDNNTADLQGHAEGYRTKATYARGHAQNDRTRAGWRSTAEGFGCEANNNSHAGGRLSKSAGPGAFAHGLEYNRQIVVNKTPVTTTQELTMHSVDIPVNVSVTEALAIGDHILLLSEGLITTDNRRIVAISEDGLTITIEDPFYEPLQPSYADIDQDSLVFPVGTAVYLADKCEATGNGSAAFGCATKATGNRSFVSGHKAKAKGDFSRAGGNGSEATGESSVAEGEGVIASGICAEAKGYKTKAKGNYSATRGNQCESTGDYTDTAGFKSIASGSCSSARGNQCTASGDYAEATGNRTTAAGYCQNARGRRNIPNPDGKYLDIVGNSRGDDDSNAYTLDWKGNGWFQGGVQVGGTEQDGEGVGYVPAVRTASVGQTIVVKAVDGNGKPTEWECVDMTGGISQTRLWQNASPTSTFAHQTLTVDLEPYNRVEIVFLIMDGTLRYQTYKQMIRSGNSAVRVESMSGDSNVKPMVRTAFIKMSGSNYGIEFSDGTLGTNLDNTIFVPFQIFGIK